MKTYLRWLHRGEEGEPMSPRRGLFLMRDAISGKLASVHLVLAVTGSKVRMEVFDYENKRAPARRVYWARVAWYLVRPPGRPAVKLFRGVAFQEILA